MGESTLIASTEKLTRQQLQLVPTPPGTATHRPVPHSEVVEALIETLGFRHIGVVKDEFAISKDGMKMFGVLDLDTGMHGCGFSIGIRNAHDKSMRLAMTVGYRVFVCENMAFSGDFQPVLAKHSKHFALNNALSIGVDQMQRNFDGMRKQVDTSEENLLWYRDWQLQQQSALPAAEVDRLLIDQETKFLKAAGNIIDITPEEQEPEAQQPPASAARSKSKLSKKNLFDDLLGKD